MKTATIEIGGPLSTLSARGVENRLAKLPGMHKTEANYSRKNTGVLAEDQRPVKDIGLRFW